MKKIQVHEHLGRCEVCMNRVDQRKDCRACGGAGMVLTDMDRNYTMEVPAEAGTEGASK